MIYTASVIMLGKRKVIKVEDQHGYLIGYFDSVEEMAKKVNLARVLIKDN